MKSKKERTPSKLTISDFLQTKLTNTQYKNPKARTGSKFSMGEREVARILQRNIRENGEERPDGKIELDIHETIISSQKIFCEYEKLSSDDRKKAAQAAITANENARLALETYIWQKGKFKDPNERNHVIKTYGETRLRLAIIYHDDKSFKLAIPHAFSALKSFNQTGNTIHAVMASLYLWRNLSEEGTLSYQKVIPTCKDALLLLGEEPKKYKKYIAELYSVLALSELEKYQKEMSRNVFSVRIRKLNEIFLNFTRAFIFADADIKLPTVVLVDQMYDDIYKLLNGCIALITEYVKLISDKDLSMDLRLQIYKKIDSVIAFIEYMNAFLQATQMGAKSIHLGEIKNLIQLEQHKIHNYTKSSLKFITLLMNEKKKKQSDPRLFPQVNTQKKSNQNADTVVINKENDGGILAEGSFQTGSQQDKRDYVKALYNMALLHLNQKNYHDAKEELCLLEKFVSKDDREMSIKLLCAFTDYHYLVGDELTKRINLKKLFAAKEPLTDEHLKDIEKAKKYFAYAVNYIKKLQNIYLDNTVESEITRDGLNLTIDFTLFQVHQSLENLNQEYNTYIRQMEEHREFLILVNAWYLNKNSSDRKGVGEKLKQLENHRLDHLQQKAEVEFIQKRFVTELYNNTPSAITSK